ncbi:S46 family peptidase [Persicobacter psychrovividus]|uniref:Dipeptidyl-peptidase n=1 Tax=Persicobacter psychrovividus TaxID=387638 RepID=A0ABM7VF64_9BACT|nr:hypothetical protein PEPS_18860 [Persicobacter psychrovividus]
MIKRLLVAVLLLSVTFPALADEGMWLPMLIKRLNYEDMQKKGLKLTPEEIYSVNQASLKDAIVSFGGFCTGEVISKEGLVLTNHHCGYGSIQEHSTLEHDYLTDGFWATSKQHELPNPKLFVRFLVRMEDVTDQVKAAVNSSMSDEERSKGIGQAMREIAKKAEEGNDYQVDVKPLFKGNAYYMFVYETYRDVRLVGTPPSSIGKYGGDTDNWMWPRHTGDFSLFRIYMSPDGKPASYDPKNVPFKPKHYLPVSLDGVQEGDFAMIMGYPGSTKRYLSSYGVKEALDVSYALRIKLMQTKLEILKQDMSADDKTRIQYASKYASTANYWKYLIGQTKGLKRLRVYDKKQKEENEFASWVKADSKRTDEFGKVLPELEHGFKMMTDYSAPIQYSIFVPYLTEFIYFTRRFQGLQPFLAEDEKAEGLEEYTEALKPMVEEYFKDYSAKVDKKVFRALLEMYYKEVSDEYRPDVFAAVNNVKFGEDGEKSAADFDQLVDYIFENSFLFEEDKLMAFLNNPSAEAFKNDPAMNVADAFIDNSRMVQGKVAEASKEIARGERGYIKALMMMHPDKAYYPDANSTMRVTYGQTLAYDPADAVHYDLYTTLDGVMEKEDPTNPEFVVPAKLKSLWEAKDYGQYANDKGELVTCFLSNNDITGGNSGSPVINGKGELIGTAFDGNWEAMSGDIAFEPDVQRTISVDIRYTLFIIDKFAGASHLIDEMTLVKTPKEATSKKRSKKKKKSRRKKN